ncbi:hypothetical protein [Actinoallomurus rhizosphaericola]|uniref:hypothetical protein n=1 Tax=Actinoallomurus rhizosphaericola TaxID=2952536 RepID=UPI0020901B7F|nr:hypothetical protein [Actinoallomurus rhizosphaericola]MCO5994790.1 hypothetical protein [Actinoallomurus rhizosphaericola]
MTLLVRLRPNGPYLLFMLAAVAALVFGVTQADLLGTVIAVCGAVLLVLFGGPVVVSTVGRVPVVAVDESGVRLPLMGVRLSWDEVADVRRTVALRGKTSTPVLLIVPTQPEIVVDRVRPWLFREARGNLARYGTPIVLSDQSLDHSLDDITTAVRRLRPAVA